MYSSLVSDTIEGAFIELIDGSIWAIKGFTHPKNGLICFPKYIPVLDGYRVKGIYRYNRLSGLSEMWSVIRDRYKHYISFSEVYDRVVPIIPLNMIKHFYSPVNKTLEVVRKTPSSPIYRDLRDFILLLCSEAGIPLSRIGISGSLLVGIVGEESDIDLVVYGREYGLKVYNALKRLHIRGVEVSRLTEKYILRLYQERVKDTKMLFKVFSSLESRKILQGIFRNRMYFIRLLKYDKQIEYGRLKFKSLGKVIVRAKIVDTSESIFTPCTYSIEVLEVAEGDRRALLAIKLYSLRGRFCELVWDGAEVLIQGRLEQCIDLDSDETYYQISVNDPGDIIIPIRREINPLQP